MLNHKEIETTLLFIRPKAEWSLTNGNLTWFDNNQQEPTMEEIIEGFELYNKEIVDKRNVALAKLEALGLNEADLKALGL